ncbi:MAG: hypothetical protein ABW047_09730 [Nitrospiraceae bacterium]
MSEHRLFVEAHAGYKGEETPSAFVNEGIKRKVVEVAACWYTDTTVVFRVLTDDGQRYVLRYAFDEAAWELVMQERS